MKTPAYTPPPKLCLTILYHSGTFAVCLEHRGTAHDHADCLTREATPREAAYAQRLFLSDPHDTPNAKDVE